MRCEQTHRQTYKQTNKQTNTLIVIFRPPTGVEVTSNLKLFGCMGATVLCTSYTKLVTLEEAIEEILKYSVYSAMLRFSRIAHANLKDKKTTYLFLRFAPHISLAASCFIQAAVV